MTLAIALARFACLVALAAVAGALILARRCNFSPRPGRLAGLAIAALALAGIQTLLQAALATGDGLTLSVLATFLGSTWGGKVALLRFGLIALIAVVLLAACSAGTGASRWPSWDLPC